MEESLVYEDGKVAPVENITEVYKNWEELEVELLTLVNDYRSAHGLQPMQIDPTAYMYAKSHNEYMITQGKLSHDNFSSRAQKLTEQTGGQEVAENVARNYPTTKAVLEGWLNSQGHRKNIEGNYNYTGISIKSDPDGNLYFTQIFLRM